VVIANSFPCVWKPFDPSLFLTKFVEDLSSRIHGRRYYDPLTSRYPNLALKANFYRQDPQNSHWLLSSRGQLGSWAVRGQVDAKHPGSNAQTAEVEPKEPYVAFWETQPRGVEVLGSLPCPDVFSPNAVYPANLCSFFGCLELLGFGNNLDEPVGEAIEKAATRGLGHAPAEHFQNVLGGP
jgi:hypothetical protein